MFGRHDYHGTRNYAADKPRSARPDEVGLRGSLIIAWVKLQIEKFLRAGSPPTTSTLLMRGDEKHFTTLGSRRSRERPITDLFPVEADDRRSAGRRRAH